MTEQTVRIPTEDGESLLCGIFPGPEDRERAFLLIPGFWGDWRREAYRCLARDLSARGTVLVSNMRGHPGSSGRFAFGSREDMDAAALYSEARRRGFGEVTAVGFSLGGWALARHLASRGDDRARTLHLVLVSTPARLPLLPRPWKRGLLLQLARGGKGWVRPSPQGLWPPRDLTGSVVGLGALPVSLVYARGDWMVHEGHGEGLRAAVAGPCRWVLIEDARGLHAEMLSLFHREKLLDSILTAPR